MAQFHDFQLHLEFKLEDSGEAASICADVMRYRLQMMREYRRILTPRGRSFGQVVPDSNAVWPQGEWQTLDVTLIGRIVTVTVNGISVIRDAEIPGIPGAAFDSHEELPGPIMLQGDHGRVSFRNIMIAPRK